MGLSPACDLFVLCGEPSGDAYAGAIIAELRRRHPALTVAAMGGEHCRAAGAVIEQPIDGLAVMGLLPVLARLPEFIRLGMRLARIVRDSAPAVVVTVDYPGFNLRLLRRLAGLRQRGTRFIHVVAPQVWAWKPRRAKSIAASVDRLLCFFPFEPPLFNRFAGRWAKSCTAQFIGHPLVDLVAAGAEPDQVRSELGLAAEDRLLLLAPGSREREVATLLPVFHQAAEALSRRLPRVRVAVSRHPDVPLGRYRAITHFPLVEGRFRSLCAAAQAGLVASGTASLEASLLGLPHVIAYRMDPPTAAIARHLIRTDHVGLPNIVLGWRAVPEVLQRQLDPVRLTAHLLRLWDGPRRSEMLADLAAVRAALGGGGALTRIADVVAEELTLAIAKRGASRTSDRLRSEVT
ncbi:lipid-A-disaccharide synthase [Planctomycetota bacterium]|nr:lipid-A-disaccharide synthase [Planctomycetota bacterium]